LRRQFRTIAGLKTISAVRNVSAVFGKGHVGQFRLAQPGAIAALPAILAVGKVLREIRRLRNEKDWPETETG
jgi:hypothetical protein